MSEEYINFLKGLSIIDNYPDRHKTIKDNCDRYNRSIEDVEIDFELFVDQILKAKCKDMMSQKTLLGRSMAKTRITGWLLNFVSRKEAENIVEKYDVEQKEIEIFTLADLLQLSKTTKNKFLVKSLLPRGDLFLLAAAPKIGKSLFTTSLALAIARGTPFLNRQTEKGKVLYIQNEEELESTTIGRVHSHGLQMLELEDSVLYQELINSGQLMIARNFDLVNDREIIVQYIKDNDISLVLADSLSSSIIASGYTEHSPELVKVLYQWQKHCHTLGFTFIVVHHATKIEGSGDRNKLMNAVAGGNGLLRANGGVFRLNPGKDESVILNTIPREREPITLTYKLVKGEACLWDYEVLQDTHLSPEIVELQNDILFLLYERYKSWIANVEEDAILDENSVVYGHTLTELVELTNEPKQLVIQRLNDMKTTEAITCKPNKHNRAFVYAIHYTGESWMKSYLDLSEIKNKEEEEKIKVKELYVAEIKKIADSLRQLIIDQNLKEIRELFVSLTIQEKKDVEKELLVNEKNNLLLLFNPSDFDISQVVLIKESKEVGKITKIEFATSAKVGYHKYYINQMIKPFLKEQIEKHEINCESIT